MEKKILRPELSLSEEAWKCWEEIAKKSTSKLFPPDIKYTNVALVFASLCDLYNVADINHLEIWFGFLNFCKFYMKQVEGGSPCPKKS